MSKSSRKSRHQEPRSLSLVHAHAAGIDCGARDHYVAVPEGRAEGCVRSFKTFTGDLYRLADWLTECRIETVAMESTGVYWIPVFEILQERGFEVLLVNARHVKNVPGRKSDVSDSQWLQQLHAVGLLQGSFHPDAEVAQLRSYVRHRENLIRQQTTQVQLMQKALSLMNVQLHLVVTDITGVTGMRIIRDIVAGRRDPEGLAQHRDHRCKSSEQEIAAALRGHYRPEHIFSLRQSVAHYDFLQGQLSECDDQIEMLLAELTDQPLSDAVASPPAPRRAKHRPRVRINDLLTAYAQQDLTQIDSINAGAALKIIAEVGTDMSKWPSANHFAAWTTLAPVNKVSGGRRMSSKTPRAANRVAIQLRLCAMSLTRSETALGANYRRLAFRIGKSKALTAIARKLALLVYKVLNGDIRYEDRGAQDYDERHRARTLKSLKKRAAGLGFNLVPTVDPVVVS